MPNWNRKRKNARPGSPKGIKRKAVKRSTYKAPVLSTQDKAALANMQPVTIRMIMSGERHTPSLHPSNTGDGRMVGEYSIRSCNNVRR
jgi:hypothetical protein